MLALQSLPLHSAAHGHDRVSGKCLSAAISAILEQSLGNKTSKTSCRPLTITVQEARPCSLIFINLTVGTVATPEAELLCPRVMGVSGRDTGQRSASSGRSVLPGPAGLRAFVLRPQPIP
ncbi:hypothetical protein BN77_2505 [Rhizobium mesoamericanum STM3625]|uniref:Uncharacterized protein n=1 Tax=Rhizobium mesoamericanum STM3625 TaxID=1211777 RepID=K0PVX2_9HYPH|nr:hypothetical protein BN77_2505 [Rhizobium mesoamericanum STM3625]